MSALYGTVQGSRGEATRCGASHLTTTAASWRGAIRVDLSRDAEDRVTYEIWRTPWRGHGEHKLIEKGELT